MKYSLDASYAWCRKATRRAGSNFFWSFHVLPREQRNAMYALYSFARYSDDLVDDCAAHDCPPEDRSASTEPDWPGTEPVSPEQFAPAVTSTLENQARLRINAWRTDFSSALRSELHHPMFPALVDTIDRFNLPTHLLFDILDGVEMDLDHQVPETFEDWVGYCDRVASAVGIACIHIWGYSDRSVFEPARRCGWAFQLTNILRDLAEDADRGRVYLPREDLLRHRCTADDLVRKREVSHVHELIQAQIERARRLYVEAAETRKYLYRSGRRAFDLMFARYQALLEKIASRPDQVFGPRIGLSTWGKLTVAARTLLPNIGVAGAVRQSPGPAGHTPNGRVGLWFERIGPAMGRRRVAVIGGGLAGLAATLALSSAGLDVSLFEARRQLGGRAGSFVDPETSELIDHCQHVGMGCCRQWIQFLEATDTMRYFRRDHELHFIGPDGRHYSFAGTRGLPAPLHLASSVLRASYLSLGDRCKLPKLLRQLEAWSENEHPDSPAIGQWLRDRGVSETSLRRFWGVVLVSALGESLDKASVTAARKVFVDGFMSDSSGYELLVPQVPLCTIYDVIADRFRAQGVTIHCGAPVVRIDQERGTGWIVHSKDVQAPIDGPRSQVFDSVIVAVPWRRFSSLFDPNWQHSPDHPGFATLMSTAEQLEPSAITSVHLWFDRRFLPVQHAVLIDRLAQWVFQRPLGSSVDDTGKHYLQVVISASQSVATLSHKQLVEQVVDELRVIWPAARTACLVHWRVICQNEAVFSYRSGLDRVRPDQKTDRPGLYVAGDWTRTGWPATLEGAVRSGNLAAMELIADLRKPLRQSSRKSLPITLPNCDGTAARAPGQGS